VVGDRLDSDVAGAIAAGYPSLLVLTGVSTAADLLVATPDERPTYIAADLRGLLRRHRGVALDGLTARCGGARAGWVDGRVAVSVGPDEAPDEADGLDPLRVAAAVSWAASAAGHEPYWDDAHVAALLEPPTGANAAASGR
jgi:hypothetical protein